MMPRDDEPWGLWAGAYRVPLRSVAVTAVLLADHAAVVLRQRYRNDGPRPIEAIYTMPLPPGAALTGLAVEGPRGCGAGAPPRPGSRPPPGRSGGSRGWALRAWSGEG